MSKSICVVDVVGLLLAQIPLDAGAAQHRAREAELHRALRRDHADVHGALLPDAVVGEQRFVFVDAGRKALGEVLDEIQQAAGAPRIEAIASFLLRHFDC
jgi:hypothetical protein